MRRLLILLAVGMLACGGREDRALSAHGYYGVELAVPVPKPPFVFADTRGRPFRFDSATANQVTLLFYGYTHCPDVCPIHLANIAAVLDKMPEEVQRRITVVFVTTDPARDTGQVLERWVKGFDSHFIALSAPDSILSAAEEITRLPVAEKGAPDSTGAYIIGHASAVIAYTTDGRGILAYGPKTRQREWAHDLPLLIAAGR